MSCISFSGVTKAREQAGAHTLHPYETVGRTTASKRRLIMKKVTSHADDYPKSFLRLGLFSENWLHTICRYHNQSNKATERRPSWGILASPCEKCRNQSHKVETHAMSCVLHRHMQARSYVTWQSSLHHSPLLLPMPLLTRSIAEGYG